MAGDHIKIDTPRGVMTVIQSGDVSVAVKMTWNAGFAPQKQQAFLRAQQFVDSECLRYMSPLTPRRTGNMIKSATLGTVIGSGEIVYLAPYARRQYYEHKEKAHWFETMKASKKDVILKGTNRIAGQ